MPYREVFARLLEINSRAFAQRHSALALHCLEAAMDCAEVMKDAGRLKEVADLASRQAAELDEKPAVARPGASAPARGNREMFQGCAATAIAIRSGLRWRMLDDWLADRGHTQDKPLEQ